MLYIIFDVAKNGSVMYDFLMNIGAIAEIHPVHTMRSGVQRNFLMVSRALRTKKIERSSLSSKGTLFSSLDTPPRLKKSSLSMKYT